MGRRRPTKRDVVGTRAKQDKVHLIQKKVISRFFVTRMFSWLKPGHSGVKIVGMPYSSHFWYSLSFTKLHHSSTISKFLRRLASSSEKYQKLDPVSHVLLRPGMYVGSIARQKQAIWLPPYSDIEGIASLLDCKRCAIGTYSDTRRSQTVDNCKGMFVSFYCLYLQN